MTKKIKAAIYLTYLDQILAGEIDIGPVEDEDVEKLLLLAKTMIGAGFSENNIMKANLRKKLFAQITKKSNSSVLGLSRNREELDEVELEYVAAGFAAGKQKDICPYCVSRFRKPEGKCLLWSH